MGDVMIYLSTWCMVWQEIDSFVLMLDQYAQGVSQDQTYLKMYTDCTIIITIFNL